MPCSSCPQRETRHYVKFKDGSRRRFETENAAKTVAKKTPDAEYQKVQK